MFEKVTDPKKPWQNEENKVAAKYKDLKEKEISDPKLEAVLSEVDYGILFDIFSRHARKSGVDVSSMRFIKRDRTDIVDEKGMEEIAGAKRFAGVALSVTDGDAIVLNSQVIEEVTTKHGFDYDIAVLHFVAHEEAHITGPESREHYQVGRELGNAFLGHLTFVEKRQSGLQQLITIRDLDKLLGKDPLSTEDVRRARGVLTKHACRMFSEGVLEMFTKHVTLEYLQRQSFRGKTVVDAEQFYNDRNTRAGLFNVASYDSALNFAEAFVRKLAKETGNEETSVRQSLFAAHYQKIDFLDPEFQELMDATIGAGFTERLTNINTGLQTFKFVDLMQDYKFEDWQWPPDIISQAKKFLSKLGLR